MADTVPAVLHPPLVPHDRSSVRQKRPRSRVKSYAVLKYLCLMGLLIVANRGEAQNRAPARDSIVAPLFQLRVSADSADLLQRPRSPLRLAPELFSQTADRPFDYSAIGPFGYSAIRLFGSSAIQPVGSSASSPWRPLSLGRGPLSQAAIPPRPIIETVKTRPPAATTLQLPDLPFRLNSRLEGKYEQVRNDRCAAQQYSALRSNCTASWTPGFDFQLDVVSKGTVAERVHVDLDFNSQREFGGSNNVSVRYEGRPGRAVENVEIGNISFKPPESRFITSGIPSGNYGVLARGRIGAFTYTGVAAKQTGNVTKDATFMVGGDRAVQQQSRALEDVGMELRRFFLTVDPRQFAEYPNIDILNRAQMLRLAASLPDSVRPARLYIYKQLIGAINPNPNGPQLSVRGARNSSRQIYEVLRENVDYYVDPSQLWIALVAPLSGNERLAVAYEVNINGVPGRNVNTGGTPDVEATGGTQIANLLWEPELQPTDPNGYFQREVKSVYRLGGDEIRRESITMKIVTGTSGDQEKARDPSRGATYLQLFGMAQATNPAALDIENRVWPRPQDPNRLASAPTQKLLRDNFLVFPSLQPFARAGLAQPFANPANDTLYTYPNEYLYSQQRPQSIFRLQTEYLTEGYGTNDALELGTQQIRPLSERVLLDGQPLIREVDYTTNYELGVINFNRADTLFLQQRQVVVRFEENQAFATAPTSIFGLSSLLALDKGQLGFTVISQRQNSTYNRPPLGLESAGSLMAGITANFAWNATALTSALNKLPFATPDATSRIRMIGELAVSKPQRNSAQAYLATFEDNAGRSIQLSENAWALSSQPAAGSTLSALLGGTQLTLNRNSTIAFQNNPLDARGSSNSLQFTSSQIDPRVLLRGVGTQSAEDLLWLTLYPLRIGGLPGIAPGTGIARNAWTIGNSSSLGVTPSGQRWASMHTVLSPSGDDLSRTENVEFFALIDTSVANRAKNPIIVLDFGDISENRVAFSPETLTVTAPIGAGLKPDSTYRGKRLAGYDRFDSERDPFSRAFNALDNDTGIAGSVADTIIVVDRTAGSSAAFPAEKVPICRAEIRQLKPLGDNRANCTVRNNRLDEEDIDLDGQLNLKSDTGDREQWKRFTVDLSNDTTWTRIGGCRTIVTDSSAARGVVGDSLCWVQVRLNWRTPNDSLNAPSDRRMRALRLTMVSAAGATDDAFSRIALAKFELIGAPWLRRSDRPLSGIAGDSAARTGGYVISSRIGTQDTSANLAYQPPPGVVEESEEQVLYGRVLQQVNEHSLRLRAGAPGGFPVFGRAESYFRFPQGNNTFMNYRTLRVWMRGRGNGWGPNGELNAFIKIGRDENNFYMYRTTVQAGLTATAWEPEVRVDLERFQSLRAQLENNSLRNTGDSLSCTGADLELIKRSGLPRGVTVRRFAVCQGGYIVYSADPGITPPNLAGVQELAVGFVRIDSIPRGGSPISPSDTLELWVNEVRLSDVVAEAGFAGEIGLFGNAGDVADFRINFSRRDPNFRQLGEAPTFLTSAGVSAGTTVHLERLLPRTWGIVMPLSINYGRTNVQQLFINQTDVRADGIQGLRSPRDSRIDYAMSLRRGTPVVAGWYAPLINGLTLSGIWGRGNGQSTFQKARNNNYAVSASLNINGAPVVRDSSQFHLPGMVDRLLGALPAFMRESESVRGLRAQRLRWRPSRFQVLTGVARNAHATTSFLTPVSLASDSGVAIRNESHLWQNSTSLEFRPINAISASLSARQSLDLRDYDPLPGLSDSLNPARAARAERVSLFGMGKGLERERTFGSSFEFRPGIAPWLEPSVRYSSAFSLYKDPNARALLRDSLASGGYRLPKRLGALQSLDASLNFDAGRLISARAKDSTRADRLGRAILPFRIDWTRTLTSNYDNTALNPSLGYQFGLAGLQTFRGLNTILATGAGRLSTLSASGAIQLPLSLTLRSSFQQGSSETWTRRVIDNFQALITNDNKTFPNADATWRWTLAKPNKVMTGLTATVGYVVTENNTVVLSETGNIVEQSRSRSESQPMSAQVNWSFLDGVRTSVSLRRSVRVDSRPGSVTRNNNPLAQTYTIDKDFTLPEKWKARSKLKTSASYDFSGAVSVVEDVPSLNRLFVGLGVPSVLTNNGRRQFNFRADTDLSEVASFSLTGSRTVVFDRNYNRQTTLTVFSTVLQLHFGAGEMR